MERRYERNGISRATGNDAAIIGKSRFTLGNCAGADTSSSLEWHFYSKCNAAIVDDEALPVLAVNGKIVGKLNWRKT